MSLSNARGPVADSIRLSAFLLLIALANSVLFAQNGTSSKPNGATPDCANAGWDAQFAPRGTNEDVRASAVMGTDIYFGGAFSTTGDKIASGVVKYETITGTWSPLGEGTNDQVWAIAVHGTDVFVGGFFTSAGGVAVNRIAKYDSLTGAWSPLETGVQGTSSTAVYSLAIVGDELFVGGNFISAGSVPASNIARWNLSSQTWSTVGSGVAGGGFFAGVRAMESIGSDLFVGGEFSSAGGVAANNIAKWDGTAWSPLIAGSANGLGDAVFALESDGATLFAGGRFFGTVAQWDGTSFTLLNGPMQTAAIRFVNGSLYAGGSTDFLGRWDGAAWQPLGTGIETGTEGVMTFSVVGDNLYVGGRLIKAGGRPVSRIARWNLTTSQWSVLSQGQGLSGFFGSEVVAANGTDVYIGGRFRGAGGENADGIVRYDAVNNSYFSMGSGTLSEVLAIEPAGTDIYVGGDFAAIGGIAASRIAKYDTITGTWSALGAGVSGGSAPAVNSILVKDGFVYVGGLFGSAGGVTASNIARYNIATGTWSSLGAGTNFFVFALEENGDDIFVGGGFTTAGGIPASRIARFSTTTNSWSALGSGVTGTNAIIYSIAIDGAGNVFVGGGFTGAGAIAVSNVARWNGAAWSSIGDVNSSTTSSVVRSVVLMSGRLYVAGVFDQAGGQLANSVAVWDGGGWSALGSGFTVPVSGTFPTSIAVAGNDLYFGGSFWIAGGKPSNFIARYRDSVATWTGSSDSDWNNPLNWQNGAVPTPTDRVIIPSSGVLNQPTITTPVSVCSLTVRSGRNLSMTDGNLLSVNNLLLLDGGTVTTGAGAPLDIGPGVSLQRNAGHVIGGIRKVGVTAGSTFDFYVGSATGYSPATVTFDSGSGDFTVSVVQSAMPGLASNRSLARHWKLTSNGITQADVTFQYLQTDVPSVSPEAAYYFHRNSGGAISTFAPSTSNITTNIFRLNDVTQFSDWTLGEHSAPGCVAGQATWDGGGATNNWSEAANWLCDAVPQPSEPVFVNNRSVKNLNIDTDLNIGSLMIDLGFTGTISQGASNVAFGGDFIQRSGTFAGGSGTIDFNGRFEQSAGTFSATTATTSFAGDFLSSGVFNHNLGTVVFDGGAATLSFVAATTFNNLTFAKTVSSSVTGTPFVAGSLRLADGVLSGGPVDARGDVIIESGFDGGSLNLTFSQFALQNLTNNGGVLPTGFWQISKNGGTLQLTSDLDLSAGTGNIILTNGTVTTGSFVLNAGNRNVSRSSGRVIGNLRRSFTSTGTKVFDVGTASGYSPVSVNVTAGTGALTIGAVQGNRPGMDAAQSAQRYWTLTESGDLTANLTFTYLQTDVAGIEANYKLFKWNGSTSALVPSTLNTTSNTVAATGISEFSDWAVGNLFVPTAAGVSLEGRVFSSDGRPLRQAIVHLTDSRGITRSRRTNSFGNYRFEDLEPGDGYVVNVSAKSYRFQARIVSLTENVSGFDLFPLDE